MVEEGQGEGGEREDEEEEGEEGVEVPCGAKWRN